ncbi:MAG: ASCH domain-containing protein [Actinobacteria bacterium]|nr:ASCH domain-containing protein [Actinomycetota bacterium]
MSVTFTEQAVVERRKTVTRRKGWTFLKAGDRLTLCRKVMGRKPGEPLVRLAEVEVTMVSREPLRWLHGPGGRMELAFEGFPGMDPAEFIRRYFTEAQGMQPDDHVTRIEWRYLDGGDA